MNQGEGAATDLYQRARTGDFRLDVATARHCAATFLRFAAVLDPHIDRSHRVHTLGGFGDFGSARQLRRGFERKGRDLTGTLTALRSSAEDMAAAYLLAAGLIRATDDTHSRALLAAAAGL
ncbi:hypothetical protein ABZ412_16350 [Nocardia sp. NPDC005746]|uniref:hypothetical protein n=1 Tax=unclassified Nocardia TaxID=2637762 RepID=UPI00340BCD6C